ncbi:unnamed protein product, partial [Rotaria sp. Silwood2]
MISRNHKRRNTVLNEHQFDTIDNNVLVVDDINENTNDLRHESTAVVGVTTSTRLYKGQPTQILEHNGQLFVPVQEEYPLQNRLSKQVYKDGNYVNMMNHRTDNKIYDL